MVTGWYWIDGMCYYFNPVSDGTRGAMKRNCEIDGYQLNADGIWVVNGVQNKYLINQIRIDKTNE